MNLCIFEDFFISNLYPLNHLRHSSEIICGSFPVKDKALHYIKPKNLFLYSRNYLSSYLQEKYKSVKVNTYPGKDCLFVNSRVLFTKELAKKLTAGKKNNIWVKDNCIIAIHAGKKVLDRVNKVFSAKPAELSDFKGIDLDLAEIKSEINIINNPSDIINFHKEELDNDLKHILKIKKLKLSPKSIISKQAEFDTSEGAVFIGRNSIIEPFCYIKGPVFIGNNSIIRSGSSIYGPVTIGNFSKISGEISSSVIHSYVNKQHLGFLGHSYLCEWVNLGAGTVTSNLKNNYSEIEINTGSRTFKTGSIFLGSIIGDHTKTGINTMLNTGTVTGISCNLFGSGYHKKMIKSFSWADAGAETAEYDFQKALETAKVSMKRRNIEMSKSYEDIFKYVYLNKDKLGV